MMAGDLFGENQDDALQFNWKDSTYRFTEPVRYFKSNDPYYWEVDNIPVKQLEENILWLKDQLATFEVSGIHRQHFSELKPYAAGGTSVKIKPGKFLGRVNDAYQKGIVSLQKTAFESLDNGDRRLQFGLSTTVLKSIAGDILNFPLYNNGLYENLQHHDVGRFGSPSLAFRNLVPDDDIINYLPKNRLAKWKQGFTSTNTLERLNQQAVEFTRRWGGVVRTSLVNVAEELEVDVPLFSSKDYANHTDTSPSVRFDLLFIYTHPVDAPSTAIVRPDGEGPTIITKPRLGIVKGAGVVNLIGRGSYTGYDSAEDANFFDSAEFSQDLANGSSYFDHQSSIDGSSGKYQIMSTMSDQLQQSTGLKGFYGNFPSPDDLMNLTPLLQEDIENNNLVLLGQSVLPVAYIVVKKGATQITNNDIIDIRPFFRTAELSYNERAGIAAAFPPLSFANPAVGKTEMLEAITKAVAYVKDYVDGATAPIGGDTDVDTSGTVITPNLGFPISTGTILGGLKYGVEGALVANDMAAGNQPTSDNYVRDLLVNKYGYVGLQGTEYLPLHAGWEVAPWCIDPATGGSPAGSLRNDRVWCSFGDSRSIPSTGNALVDAYVELITSAPVNGAFSTVLTKITNVPQIWRSSGFTRTNFLKKTITIDNVPASVVDYSVKTRFSNCTVISPLRRGIQSDNMNPHYLVGDFRDDLNYTQGDIIVEKGSITGNKITFTIFVLLPSFGSEGSGLKLLSPGASNTDRSTDKGSSVAVYTKSDSENLYNYTDTDKVSWNFGSNSTSTNNNSSTTTNQSYKTYDDEGRGIKTSRRPWIVTYPTVEFEVTGYTSTGSYIYEPATQVFN